ncbi:hypothetical protein BaRGS_00017384 [Batillaria attramentaria]|uniref:Mesenchyme-specific cell surface glycoprotein n=1 Tax=Batillaria attramentaria TaxID=370345 RepID=A0ABD0KWK2_9CAEN
MYSALVLLLATVSPAWSVFRLEPGAFMKLPDQLGRTTFDNGAANKADYDAEENFLYVIGYRADVMHVVNMADPANPSLAATKTFNKVNEGLPDSVKVCRGGINRDFLAVSFEAPKQTEHAHVHLYELLTPATVNNDLVHLKDVVTLDSYDPKAMAWTPTCTQLVVISEGDPHEVNGVFTDPPGDVELLTPSFGYTVDRQSIPLHEDDLATAGIRQVFHQCDSVTGSHPMPPQSSRKQDLEAKTVHVDQNSMAYIVFQENNAIAKYDLTDFSPDRKLQFFDLGTKDWGNYALDGAYEDQAVALEERPGLRSLYQPNSLVSFELDGKTWLATADQGSIRRYTLATCRYDESVEGYDYVTAFGGRGFSIYDADNMNRVYDSGDSLERYFVSGSASQAEEAMFNAKVGTATSLQTSQRDRASPETGPTPSAIAVADWSNSTKVLVIANGLYGGLYVYSVNSGPSVNFEGYIRRGNPAVSWRDAYDADGDGVGEPEITDLLYFSDEGQSTVVAVSSKAAALSFYRLVENP